MKTRSNKLNVDFTKDAIIKVGEKNQINLIIQKSKLMKWVSHGTMPIIHVIKETGKNIFTTGTSKQYSKFNLILHRLSSKCNEDLDYVSTHVE